MKPTILGIIIVLALIGAGAIFYGGSAFSPEPASPVVQTYSNDAYGMSFSYPVGYLLTEESGEGSYHITLIREEDAVPVVAGGEGPTAITIDIYDLDEGANAVDWMTSSPNSNFGLGPKTYEGRAVSGIDAAQYAWSGLYEGMTTALSHEGRVYAISVTYLSPTDAIRTAYEEVLDSFYLR